MTPTDWRYRVDADIDRQLPLSAIRLAILACVKLPDGSVSTSLDLLSAEFSEPALDLIDPGRASRRKVDMIMGWRGSQALILGVS